MKIESIAIIVVIISGLFIVLVVFISFVKTIRSKGEDVSDFIKEIGPSLNFSDMGSQEGFQRDYKGRTFYLSEAPISAEDYKVFRIKFSHALGESYYIPVCADTEQLAKVIGEENANYCSENQHNLGMDKEWFYLDVSYENFKKEYDIEKLMDFLITCSQIVITRGKGI